MLLTRFLPCCFLFFPFCSSKKYQELVRKSGEPAPAPIVTLRKVEEAQQAQQAQQAPAQAQAQAGFTVKPAVKSAGAAAAQQAQQAAAGEEGEEQEDGEADEGSEWETASEEEMETDQKVGATACWFW